METEIKSITYSGPCAQRYEHQVKHLEIGGSTHSPAGIVAHMEKRGWELCGVGYTKYGADMFFKRPIQV